VHQRGVAASPGDGVLYCARERLVEVAGVLGLQSVRHGTSPAASSWFELSLPFEDHG
jgi:hypothetical protein